MRLEDIIWVNGSKFGWMNAEVFVMMMKKVNIDRRNEDKRK